MSAQTGETRAKPSKLWLVLGVVAALLGGGAGFGATYLGFLDGLLGRGESTAAGAGPGASGASGTTAVAVAPPQGGGSVAFVPLDPITLNVGYGETAQILRFGAQLEVPAAHAAEVTHLMPRIMDVLNIYLRALDPHELQEASAILRLRGQMLRRTQIVTGPGLVNDLLISEFVMN